MPNKTINYNLIKPLQTENFNVDIVNNANMDILDAEIKKLNDRPVGATYDDTEIKNSVALNASSLATKANQLDVRLKANKLNATTDFDDETKAQLTGVTPITYSAIPAINSVKPIQLTFPVVQGIKSVNLFEIEVNTAPPSSLPVQIHTAFVVLEIFFG